MRRAATHAGIILLSLFCLYGIPFLNTSYFRRFAAGELDAVSAATTILDAPSGRYLVLINESVRLPDDRIEDWEKFFRGEETDLLFDDVTLSVASGDAGAMDMARSYQSRLPENQMTLKVEDPILMLSRAEAGRVDFAVMSMEASDFYHAEDIGSLPDMEVLKVEKTASDDRAGETAPEGAGDLTESETGRA